MPLTPDELRAAIRAQGGLATLAGLARRWGISKQRAHTLAEHPDFPKPVHAEGRWRLYLVSEADSFRAQVRPTGRPKG